MPWDDYLSTGAGRPPRRYTNRALRRLRIDRVEAWPPNGLPELIQPTGDLLRSVMASTNRRRAQQERRRRERAEAEARALGELVAPRVVMPELPVEVPLAQLARHVLAVSRAVPVQRRGAGGRFARRG